ncbi:Alpha-N-acetylglucosaminidase [Diplonema papillatum]|nr:Alpha-N-acetylglucosaminidase [Diplonema papillatum]
MWSVTKSIVTLRPSMSMEYEGFMPTALYYDPAVVVSAFKSLLNDSSTLGDVSLYKHDVVDFGRQALSNLMLVLNQNHTDAYNSKDGAKQARVAALIRSVISDLDDLLSSHENFLLGTWIAAARAWGDGSGSNATGAAYYEWNARNQVTLWGPHGEIHDYAAKQWGGLVRGYYAPRWDLYLTAVNKSFNAGVGFNSTAFNNDCLALEQSWQHASEPYPAAPAGDTIEIAQRIAAKYF